MKQIRYPVAFLSIAIIIVAMRYDIDIIAALMLWPLTYSAIEIGTQIEMGVQKRKQADEYWRWMDSVNQYERRRKDDDA